MTLTEIGMMERMSKTLGDIVHAVEALRGQMAKLEAKVAKLEREKR